MSDTCTCGHERDEHRNSNRGASECEVEDCWCIQFESDYPEAAPRSGEA
jgi:hypothetical protein